MKTAIEQMIVDFEESLFGDSKLTTKEIWDKALEAEKQQLREAFVDELHYNFDEYYNEKFKK